MEEKIYISNIGYTASNNKARATRSGEEYEGILPAPKWQEEIVRRNASVEETVREMQKLIKSSAWQTKELSKLLLGKDIYTTCGNIWNFLYSHIRYKEDENGQEQLRTPAVSWQIRRSRGIDCDDFSIFAGTLLYNLGIPFYLRIARYKGVGHFQHVYVIVPKSKEEKNEKEYITIDAVLDAFDEEKEPAETKDFLVMDNSRLNGIDIAVLSGTESGLFGEVNGIVEGEDFAGVEEPADIQGTEINEADLLGAIYRHMVRTRDAIRSNPNLVSTVDDPEMLGKMLDYGIGYWHTGQRDTALGILEEREEEINRMNGVDGMPDGYEETTVFYGVEGLGGISALGKTKNKKTFFKNVNKAVKDAKQKARTTTQKVKQKTKTVAKKVGKQVIKNNPVSVAARAGMLLAMKTNFLKIAEKLKWGYLTESEARDHGFDMQEWQNARTQLNKAENLFVQKLKGNPDQFKKAILQGRAGGLNGVSEDLGVVAATAAGASLTAAMPFIQKVAEFAKAIDLKKLIGKVKTSKLFRSKKKAETMPEVKEDEQTAVPENNDSQNPANKESGENESQQKEITQNEEETNANQNSNQNASRPVNNSSSTTDNTNNETTNNESTQQASGDNTATQSNTAENNTTQTTDSQETKNLPVTKSDSALVTTEGMNLMDKVSGWVKENPGKSALIAGGLILAFSSGTRKAIGLGGVKRNKKGKTKKGNKKKYPPRVISGTGRQKRKNASRLKGKPKGRGGRRRRGGDSGKAKEVIL